MIIPEDQIWMVVIGFIIAFVLAFGIGANDVANSFGTSVGAKVLTLKQACMLATICELSGSVLLGAKVSDTIRKGIVSVQLFKTIDKGNSLLMAGQVAALGGSCIWLLVATFFRLPVSGTHSIVGATIGFSLVIFGLNAIQWNELLKIVGSWFLSPVLSGLASIGVFFLMHYLVLRKEDPLEPALRLIPGFFGTVVLVNSFSIFYEGPSILKFDKIPLYGIFILSCGLGIITVLIVKFIWVPLVRRHILTGESSRHFLKHYFTRTMKKNLPSTIDNEYQSVVDAKSPKLSVENHESIDMKTYRHQNVGEAVVGFRNGRNKDTRGGRGRLTNDDSIVSQGKANQNEVPSHFEVKPSYPDETGNSNKVTRKSNQSNVIMSYSSNDQCMNTDINHNLTNGKMNVSCPPNLDTIGEEPDPVDLVKDRPAEAQVFSSLQIITAVFGSFAHGGNDVSNAIGPLIGLWIIATTQSVDLSKTTDIWILVYGGVGISVGLWIWGRRVIQTLGEDLTKMTPSSGVCIEIGSALTVLIASKIGLPISTTHCKVGSVVFVGRARSRDNVNWGIFRNILIAWLVTLPAAGAISALLMYIFTLVV
ncbi:hypothetical protein MN116_002969 [Schistosoma mekongi]|uniref:Phosphate transporter n=1 Tax=Schistosoma mekongi TaxID=38744 RepID=A0AAE1ZI08_SCHME|nr:hypothetical protein MN116_002969 [Schistosoma mekongi]